MEQLKYYIYYACQRQFSDELVDVKVSNSIPNQAFVEIVVKTVTPEITTFAKDLKHEFAEMDRQVDIHVVAESNRPRVWGSLISIFQRFGGPS